MKNMLRKIMCLLALSMVFTGCEPDDTYKEFVRDGTKLHPGKPIDLLAQAGKNRAKLTWSMIDAKVEKYVIYWNNHQDSLLVPAALTGAATETQNVLIENLAESDYVFDVVSLDNKGNRSVANEAQVNVYGDLYIGSLLNRPLISAHSMSGSATLVWGKPEETEVGVGINYIDNMGVARKFTLGKAATTITLPDYKNGTRFSFQTLYLPDSTAFDTVAASMLTPPAPVVTYPLLDKTKFAVKKLPTDQGDAWGWKLPFLWDNNLAEGNGFHTADVAFPYHFTFDLGVTTALHEMKMWQRQIQLYTGGSTRYFEVWGSTNPAADGSYTGWTKLLDGESIKPSGQASGYTAADETYAKAGESFIFPEDSPPVRYIRFKILGNWVAKSPGSTHIMEATFWSK